MILRHGIRVVWFTTTMFPVMILGPLWRRLLGASYVLDYQDPWITSAYEERGITPPGGWTKYRMARSLAEIMEPRIIREAARVVATSEQYPRQLEGRYGIASPPRFSVEPFPGPKRDLGFLARQPVRQRAFRRGRSSVHWSYVGVAGPNFERAFMILFRALTKLRHDLPDNFHIHAIGTSYADGASPSVLPIARRFGLDHLVHERTSRVGYLESLQILLDSDAILLPGTDDPSYVASKLNTCLLAGKPILPLFHYESPAVCDYVRVTRDQPLTFGRDERREIEEVATRLALLLRGDGKAPRLDDSSMQRIDPKFQAARHCRWFEEARGDA